jgi:hypothetical protein
LVEQNDLALARPIFQGLEFEAAIGQIGRIGIEAARGATVAQRVFFNAKRTPTVCLDVISLVASSCRYNRGAIEPCVAH